MLLIVVVVIDCGVSTTVNTTILLIYILRTIYYFDYLLKTKVVSPIAKYTSYDIEIYLEKFQ